MRAGKMGRRGGWRWAVAAAALSTVAAACGGAPAGAGSHVVTAASGGAPAAPDSADHDAQSGQAEETDSGSRQPPPQPVPSGFENVASVFGQAQSQSASSSSEDVASETGGDPGSEQPSVPVPGGESPQDEGPGTGEPGTGEPAGPGGDGDTSGLVDESWGLRHRWPGRYAAVADEVVDMCDDSNLFYYLNGRFLGPGDEIYPSQRQRMDEYRERWLPGCGDSPDPSGDRYFYITDVGYAGKGATAQEALRSYEDGERWHRERDPFYDQRVANSRRGRRLGHYGWDPEPESRVDRVAVIEGSVTLQDGVVRGLVHNLSASLWARGVSVTVGGERWEFPLSVQPAEAAPFEVAGWTGAEAPPVADISVEATLSAEIDISRSLVLDGAPGYWAASARGIVHPFPYWTMPRPWQEIEAGFGSGLEYRAPTSHPHLAERVMSQQIDYVRVFVAFDRDGKILEVTELTPYAAHVCQVGGQEHIGDAPVRRVSPGGPTPRFAFTFDVSGDFTLWFGGADARDEQSDALHEGAPEPTLYPDPVGPCYLPRAPWLPPPDEEPEDAPGNEEQQQNGVSGESSEPGDDGDAPTGGEPVGDGGQPSGGEGLTGGEPGGGDGGDSQPSGGVPNE